MTAQSSWTALKRPSFEAFCLESSTSTARVYQGMHVPSALQPVTVMFLFRLGFWSLREEDYMQHLLTCEDGAEKIRMGLKYGLRSWV